MDLVFSCRTPHLSVHLPDTSAPPLHASILDTINHAIRPPQPRAHGPHGGAAGREKRNPLPRVEQPEDGIGVEAVVGIAQLDPEPVEEGDE